jgi:hypothetical protein
LIPFDPRLDISPFALFRRMTEGNPPRLVDARPVPGASSLAGAVPWPAREAARRLQGEGYARVRVLFGGLELYDFALDPAVVGTERFLVRRA